jgi:hypothetical protein
MRGAGLEYMSIVGLNYSHRQRDELMSNELNTAVTCG